MIYVMSDIHGDAGRFHAMLKKIHFSDEDTLYILGDVIDRGPDGIELLQEIMAKPNMVMLLGNHEYMMVKAIDSRNTLHYAGWVDNGGAETMHNYLQLRCHERRALVEWLHSLPAHLEIAVNGNHYHLVHGFPGFDTYNQVWGRPDNLDDTISDWIGEKKIVIGHTPVLLIHAKTGEAQDTYVRNLLQRGDHLRILHAGFIDIDCGCGYNLPVSKLACLRLDDMREYYV